MTKILRLNEVTEPSEFIKIIRDKEIVIYEDIQGSQIFVRWTGQKFEIKPKSIRNETLNFVDLVTQKYYNPVFYYLHSLPDYVTDLLNPLWWFCFEYFPNDTQPANIKYEKIPKNNLILTCIVKGTRYKYDIDELTEYSKLFDVDLLPVIFKGVLSNKQLEAILLYLSTSDDDIEFIFGERNFAYFFYKLLNPLAINSFLMDEKNFNDNMEKIVIKIENADNYTFEILNPIYQKLSISNNTEYVEMYSLILLNFLEYCQLIDIKTNSKSLTKDELYVDVISDIFNGYIENMKNDIEKWELNIPAFFKKDKFKINVNLLKNKKTKEFIKSDGKIEYIFKCILGSFNKPRKKPIGIFTEQTVNLFNEFVNKLDKETNKLLKMNIDTELQKSDVKDFKDFFKIDYSTDAEGKIYPDVYKEFGGEDEGEDKKKKKKIGIGKKPMEDMEDLKGFVPKKEIIK